jgi:hypothetical protein
MIVDRRDSLQIEIVAMTILSKQPLKGLPFTVRLECEQTIHHYKEFMLQNLPVPQMDSLD